MKNQSFHIDTKQYLLELIEDYNQKLNQECWRQFYKFIKEEKFKCMHHLRRIRETEVIGIFMAKTSALVFPTTS